MLYHSAYRLEGEGPLKDSSPPGEPNQATEFWAKDDEDAKAILTARGMGETLIPPSIQDILFPSEPMLPSEWWDKGNIPQTLHAAMWLAMVATASGVATGFELLSDNGVIHNLAHLSLPQEILDQQTPGYLNRIRTSIKPALLALEAKTPGFNKREYGEDQ